eukprot:Gregarina_sp_Poly_1__2601@NODE_1706_length_3510_cov_73_638978_g1117_i0_p2_GENE_NODE_1706_length_3510_cov_73_638978_g1117_i0NODE_1706_length_3510_cov_73_638978_g1117_i0_p2_ORF_typecomplete_len324_score55_27LRR_9/PF14580_6/2_4e13LRR_9/PF14580_6/1_2e16LRR_9/PF14580_6/1_1e12LRR_9/PF14580_6/9_1e12LRR_9/PF14580_6/2_6e05LRR_9/PF14580_6/2_4e22LRR_8/PF13855_6/0_29LRR_8/PF13855_6/5e05LRR_8/PF13855_6/3_4e07LRR_8/PF13855_6/6_6e08LRR_8/PF13855_6/2_6e06LRR_8/PF13855_6/3_9e08LRR_8/PF13855_6/1_1e09LRR_8/PF13855
MTGLPAGGGSSEEEISPQENETLRYQKIGVDLKYEDNQPEIYFHLSRILKLENLDRCEKTKVLSLVSNLVEKIENLEACKSLERLELYQNRIRTIENINHLVTLTNLDLSFNRIKRIENIGNLVNLKNLFLSSNRISQMENLDSLTQLEQLELGSNKIRKVENLEKLANLKQLWLGRNRISLMELPVFNHLTYLSFQCNRLTEWNPILFSNCPKLEEAYFSENQLGNPPSEILSLSKLRVLDLGKNKVSNLSVISGLENLTELWLNDNEISSLEEVDKLKNLRKLETLYLERNPLQHKLGPGYRAAVLARLPQLTQMDALLVG